MKHLVIIPNLHHKFSFSAPLSWMFSDHTDSVLGVYSQDLTSQMIQEYESFIIECNWFVEIYEFSLIVKKIKRIMPNSKILFGGLYSQIKYKEIFNRFNVDYFIKGYNEFPIKMYLDGTPPYQIPNFVGRDFENETTSIFTSKDLDTIEYNLNWFPDYFKYWDMYPAPFVDLEPDFSRMPMFPAYNYPKKIKDPTKEFRIPSKGGRYHLPMIITSRGGCSSIHVGCDYCMGSKTGVNKKIYNGPPIVYNNDILIKHIKQISANFPYMTLYINSPFEYDFSGYFFDIEATIEVDTQITPTQLNNIMHSFKSCRVHLALYGNRAPRQNYHG